MKGNWENCQRHTVTCTTQNTAIQDQLDAINSRFEDHDSRLREMRSFLTIKDKKVTELTEAVSVGKEELYTTSIRMSKQLAKELKIRDENIIQSNRQIRSMDSVVTGQRHHLDNLST